jgi:hypothetical protein
MRVFRFRHRGYGGSGFGRLPFAKKIRASQINRPAAPHKWPLVRPAGGMLIRACSAQRSPRRAYRKPS